MSTTWLQQQRIGEYLISLVQLKWEVSFGAYKGGHFEDRWRVVVQTPRKWGNQYDTISRTEPTRTLAEAEEAYQNIVGEYAAELARDVLGLDDV